MRLARLAVRAMALGIVGAGLIAPAHADPMPPILMSHLDPPNLRGSGSEFRPVGTRTDGVPITYLARSDQGSATVSLLWIDTSLTRALYSPGYEDPGGPNSGGGLPREDWPDVVANFNGAFKLTHTRGGYFYRGTTVAPLVAGRASAVTYRDGTIAIGKWGRDVEMTPDVVSVRQNIDLMVDGARSRVTDPEDHSVWGPTTDRGARESRSAVGQRNDGSLVYAVGDGIRAVDLADALVAAGVEHAIALDMNQYWPAGFYFTHRRNGAPICAKVDSSIPDGCDRLLNRYKKDSYQFLVRP